MRRWSAVLVLAAGLLAGCATVEPERPASWLGRLRPLQAVAGKRGVLMQVALIEQPVGDPYINQELWDLADEQVIALEHKPVIVANGFRVGLLSGMPPAGLQALLTSERSCASPRQVRRAAGDPTTLLLGQARPQCRFRLVREGQTETVELEQAECALIVVPALADDGRVRLRFTPQVRHGAAALVPRPSVDPSGTYSWMLQEQRPTETYAGLGWEVILAPNDYAVVGGRADRPETLGHQCFIRPDEPVAVQRLLVIRTARAQPGPADPEDGSRARMLPLALQAAMTGKE